MGFPFWLKGKLMDNLIFKNFFWQDKWVEDIDVVMVGKRELKHESFFKIFHDFDYLLDLCNLSTVSLSEIRIFDVT